uniref:PATROL1-like C-terminal domain-containing protein n=1 Tax=Oryza meridionalis TaxID=40149 RepID=A0A0E0CSK0_9ORYZ
MTYRPPFFALFFDADDGVLAPAERHELHGASIVKTRVAGIMEGHGACPSLTRCNQDSIIIRLWKKVATPCRVPVSSPRAHGHHQGQGGMAFGGQNPRPSTSRGT